MYLFQAGTLSGTIGPGVPRPDRSLVVRAAPCLGQVVRLDAANLSVPCRGTVSPAVPHPRDQFGHGRDNVRRLWPYPVVAVVAVVWRPQQ